ncbi:MAG: Holliday junction DNA helicase RuvA [Candidatus Tagabacteria bacterium RIFCSPLOWO2_01_FULL_39_11]|uniref:Holliday junction branch migration complex subunit RuvA n=1 Tax=Candidatus Tagabacteria bacterium RIFCSPLOWO2_01_FULL_39_11 TaxID=1802295 RepID=A0A1G2LRV8_9BACT|nr:MAG: Holliday junction DNA helicase RuvA [Candidatus Tagabacteria bacterium RIFCSPLOWO2_01_FULL_39_11]
MITLLEGNVVFKTDKFLVVNAGGVGFKVFLGLETIKSLPQKSEKIKLWTHLYMRENGLELYGFLGYAELEFFEILIQISGIGPKSALGVLGVAPLDTLKRAVASGESSYLTRVSGIGKKTAERIIIELRDKLGGKGGAEFQFKEDEEVFDALKSLGYSANQAREAIKNIPEEIKSIQTRLKEALKILAN